MKEQTFSQKVKKEILEGLKFQPCCSDAFLSALLFYSSITLSSKGAGFEVCNANLDLIKVLSAQTQKLYGTQGEMYSEKKGSKETFCFRVLGEEILYRCGILYRDGEGLTQIAQSADRFMLEQECCAKVFLKGCFLMGGSISIPKTQNNATGYHMEFSAHNLPFAKTVEEKLSRFGVNFKITEKKEGYLVYAKESDQISDALVLLGASKCMFSMEDLKIERSLRNTANRQANCTLANIDKSVAASARQLEAINSLILKGKMNTLSPQLKEMAEARIEEPDASIAELAQKLNISKSGAVHRMNSLIALAGQEKTEEQK